MVCWGTLSLRTAVTAVENKHIRMLRKFTILLTNVNECEWLLYYFPKYFYDGFLLHAVYHHVKVLQA